MELFDDRLAARRQLGRAEADLRQEWMARADGARALPAAQQRRIPFAPVSTMGDLLVLGASEGARLLRRSTHPRAGRVRDARARRTSSRATPWALRRPAPRLGRAHGRGARRGRRRRGSASARGSRMSASQPARGHPRRRLHLGVGRAVLHAAARASRRRGDPRRDARRARASRACCRPSPTASRVRTAAATSTSTTRESAARRST